MKGWKRNFIWIATFIFGAIWVFAFLLPSEIGGGIDRHGMYTPTLLGTTLYYSTSQKAITSTHQNTPYRDSEIVQFNLNNTSHRERSFGFSPFRKNDYYGAILPQILELQERYLMYYIGIGHDDKRRICLAESSDGMKWQTKGAAVFVPPQEAGKNAPQSYHIYRFNNQYQMIYVGNRMANSTLRIATSTNSTDWTDQGEILQALESELILDSSKLQNGKFLALTQLGNSPPMAFYANIEDKQFKNRVWIAGWSDSPTMRYLYGIPKIRAPFAKQLNWLRIIEQREPHAAVVAGTNVQIDTRSRAGIFQIKDNSFIPLENSQPDGAIVKLSSQGYSTFFSEFAGAASDFIPVIMAFGIGLGLISIMSIHGRRLIQRKEGAFYSGCVIFAMIIMIVVQVNYAPTKPTTGIWANLNDFLFFRLQFPLGATMFGLLAAFLVSAAYRTFRVRSFDAVVLTLVASLVILTQVPTGQFIAGLFTPNHIATGATIDASATEIRNWALMVANDAVQRAVGFGAFIGAIAMAVRVWLSLDKTSIE